MLDETQLKKDYLAKMSELESGGASGIKASEVAIQDAIEKQFPDQAWWEVCDVEIYDVLREGISPLGVMEKVAESIKQKEPQRVVSVYDLKKYAEQEFEGYTTHMYDSMAILFNANGAGVICDHEAVGEQFNSFDQKIEIPLAPLPVEKINADGHKTMSISVVATAIAKVPVENILINCECKDVSFDEFFDRQNYNSRCQHNMAELKKVIRDDQIDLTMSSSAKVDVNFRVGAYFKEHLPQYDVVLVAPASNHPDDAYLYSVIAKKPETGTYAAWTCWNDDVKSLNFGHYGLKNLNDAMEILTEHFHDVDGHKITPDKMTAAVEGVRPDMEANNEATVEKEASEKEER